MSTLRLQQEKNPDRKKAARCSGQSSCTALESCPEQDLTKDLEILKQWLKDKEQKEETGKAGSAY